MAHGLINTYKRFNIERKNQCGFTVIESLISMLLLGVILTGGLSIYFNSKKILTLVQHKKIATEIANSKLEEIRSLSPTALSAIYGTATPGTEELIETINGPMNVDPASTMNVFVNHFTGTPDYRSFRVNISWLEANNVDPREVELFTYID